MEENCAAPWCDNKATLKEPTEHNEKGWMPICREHVDPKKDGIESL